MTKAPSAIRDSFDARDLPTPEGSPTEMDQLHGLLSQAYNMINRMLDRLRESQIVLQDVTVQQLQDTSAKLHEVTSATESAATDIMDGLDRALALIDRLDGGEPAEAVSTELRDEIFGVMNHLQFQDITTQQLQHASSLLHDMESQLVEFARLFDPAAQRIQGFLPAARQTSYPQAFDPAATIHDAEQRQALVDELLMPNTA